MNTVSLVGNLCKENEVRYSSGENATAFLRNTVAVQRKYKDKETGKYESDFINISAIGKSAEFINQYFTKGQKIGITGHIQTGSYTNKDGNKVYTTEVVVDSAEFVSSKGEGNGTTAPASHDDDFMTQGIDEDELTSNLPFK